MTLQNQNRLLPWKCWQDSARHTQGQKINITSLAVFWFCGNLSDRIWLKQDFSSAHDHTYRQNQSSAWFLEV